MLGVATKIREWENDLLRRNALRVLSLLGYMLTRNPWLYSRLPGALKDKLPTGWNQEMWMTAIKSGGDVFYVDYPCGWNESFSYERKATVYPQYQEYELSDGEIQDFYDKGYIGPFTLYSAEEAKEIGDHLVAMAQQPSPIYTPSDYGVAADTRSAEGEMSNAELGRKLMNARDRHLDDPTLLGIYRHPAVTERCAQLLGPDLVLWRTQFVRKKPGEMGSSWHQGAAALYEDLKEAALQPPDFNDLFELNCYYAVTDATVENGCLGVVPGTHKRIHPLKVNTYDPTKYSGDSKAKRFGTRVLEVDHPFQMQDIVPIEMKAGQFIIFTERVIHGSFDNVTQDSTRLSIIGRLVRPETQIYTDKMRNSGHELLLCSVERINLSKWQPVMLRGEDSYNLNGSVPVDELPTYMQPEMAKV